MMRLLLSGLRFHWRSHLGVLLGVVLGSAVLTGSLLVGDSVDGSLRKFALQRLGGVEYAMQTPNRFFSADLAARTDSAAALQLRGIALGEEKQVNQVQVLGCSSNLWNFAGLDFQLLENEVALNEKLAAALGVGVGVEISLRVEKPGLLPRDAPLSSQKDDRSVRGRFSVKRILSDDELGRFSLSANQVVPYNAFVRSKWLQEKTELDGKVNLLLSDHLIKLPWKPDDFGLRFREEGGILQLESDSIYLEPEASRAAMSITGAQGTLTYLVNSISNDRKSTPYSFVLAKDGDGLGDDEMVVSEWLADELDTKVGEPLTVNYFELLADGSFEERERVFNIRSVRPMEELAMERQLAPAFPGLTDVDRCSDWDVGIPMDEEQLEDEANEAYWEQFKQTPKAIISLSAGQDMWSNRFGNLTGIRWEEDKTVKSNFEKAYDPIAAGYRFQPVREQALAAVDNAMDFGLLFVGMSFFLIVASLMLTGLLFVFGVQQRAEEMGIMLAVGWLPKRVRRLMLLEGSLLAFAGSIVGAFLGIGYTKLLIAGLSNHWKGAIANSAIEYSGCPGTVAVGAVASFICALAAISISVWHQAKQPTRNLLMADFSQDIQSMEQQSSRVKISMGLAIAGICGSVGLVIYAITAELHAVTMPFFGAGALLLVSGMLFSNSMLNAKANSGSLEKLGVLAHRNVTRRRSRSLTVIGLLACGTFLVFAVSSMKEDVTAHADQPSSGSGGFGWFGESTLPITDEVGAVQVRVRDGDDAGCLNLNRAQSPRMLGLNPQAMSSRGAFCADADVWPLLNLDLSEGVVPALVGDSDTAMWGLEAKVGVEKGDLLDYVDEAGNPFKVKLVGQLPMRLSLFQGTLLIAEEHFVERYPGEEGYRMFLLDEPVENRRFERAGLNVVPATERLLEFYAIESTYLAMFLVLGVLGLVVGSLGMGVVVLRNVQDRRAELAMLRAVGYSKAKVRKLLFMEHTTLMLGGLAIGMFSSGLAMLPAFFITKTQTAPGFLVGLFVVVLISCTASIVLAVRLTTRDDVLRGLRNE